MYPRSKKDVPPWRVKFFRGGCLDYALATIAALDALDKGEGTLVGVFYGAEPHHILVLTEDGEFIDALGSHTKEEVVRFWSRELGSPVLLHGIEDDHLFGYTEDEERYEEAFEDALEHIQ